MKGITCSVDKNGFYGIYYPNKNRSYYAVVAMIGDSCGKL